MSRFHRHSAGQGLVEFALVAPVFFVLLFSIIEFGRAVYYTQMLNNAAREGARYAIVHGSKSGCPSGPMPITVPVTPNNCDPMGSNVIDTVKKYAIGVVDTTPNAFTVSVKWCATTVCPNTNLIGKGDGTNGRNQTVVVDVSYTFQPWILGFVPLPSFTLTGGSTLVINH